MRKIKHGFHFEKKIIEPNSGLGVLSDVVQSILRGLRENDITEYRMIGDFSKNMYLYQRLSEAAWPVRQLQTAKIVIGYKRDFNTYDEYYQIYSDKDVVIARIKQ